MSLHLLELAQNYFIGSTVRQVSTAFDASESSISTALRSAVPLVLGGLLAHAQQPGGAAELLGLAQQVHGNSLLGDLSGLLASLSTRATATSLPSRGVDMMHTLLGDGYEPAVEDVSQQAGVRPATVSNLLSVATAVTLGLLGRHAAQNNLDASGIASCLASQRDDLGSTLASLPSGASHVVAGLLATSRATQAGPVATAASRQAAAAAPTPGDDPNPPAATAIASPVGTAAPRASVRRAVRPTAPAQAAPSRWPWLLALLLGLAVAGYFLFGRAANEQPVAAQPAATPAAAPNPLKLPPAEPAPTGQYEAASDNYRYATGPSTTVQLPSGPKLTIGRTSTEARLLRELTGTAPAAGATQAHLGIALDRVYFHTGKATLTAESQAQLTNLVAMLRAFPRATLKLGGFTDDQGPAEANLLLSADRANAVRQALVAAGISPTRVAAQGYGQEHPIATNDTPAGRAQNRRVALLVTKK